MLCPVCNLGSMVKNHDEFLTCSKCGIRRRPNDKIGLCDKTNFYILNRNVARTPSGTKVAIVESNSGMHGMCGHVKSEGPTYSLKSEHGFIIGSSLDRDDLILLIAEHEWHSEDQKIACLLK